MSGPVTQGMPIFKLDSSKQEAAVETARRKIAETDAEIKVAQADIQKAEGQLQRLRAITSRPLTNWRPSKSCSGVIREMFRRAISSGSRFKPKAA